MKVQVFIDTANTRLLVKDKLFLIINKTIKKQISPKRIDSIALMSDAQINVSAIKLAAQNEIPIFIYDSLGNLTAQFRSPSFLKHSELRKKQLIYMTGFYGRKWVLQQMVLKSELQCQTLKRLAKQFPAKQENIQKHLSAIKKQINSVKNLSPDSETFENSLMGIEGSIAGRYFKALNTVLPEQYQFEKRSRRPGKDYFNVLLNYMYGITYGEVTRALHSAGLDTYTGVLHKADYKETLVFDFIECFRPIVDRLLIDTCIQELWQESHFVAIKNGFSLHKKGKKILLPAYSQYMLKKIHCLGKTTSIRNHMYIHARRLQQDIKNKIQNVSDILRHQQ